MTRLAIISVFGLFTLSCAAGTHVAKVPIDTARASAMAQVPGGTLKHEELEKENGRWIYSFEIRPAGEQGTTIREVNVDADSGAIVGVDTEKD